MSARPLVLVALAEPPATVAAALGAERVLLLGAVAAAFRDNPSGEQDADVVWLPAWASPGAEAIAEAVAWRARAATSANPAAARAVLRLRVDAATTMRVAPRIVLSSPGAVEAFGDAPRARHGTRVDDLAHAWDVELPADIATHLAAVNQQSSVVAGLRHAAGRTPAWRDLTLVPAGLALRALAGVTGSRRVALPRAVLEAYREVLVAAKLWELANVTAVA